MRWSDRSALVLVRDDDLRETIATLVGELSCFVVATAADLAEARRIIASTPPSVIIVAPRWLDADVAALLRELPGDDPAIVVIAASDRAPLHENAIVVTAPFDVEALLAAIEDALSSARTSRTRIAVAQPPGG